MDTQRKDAKMFGELVDRFRHSLEGAVEEVVRRVAEEREIAELPPDVERRLKEWAAEAICCNVEHRLYEYKPVFGGDSQDRYWRNWRDVADDAVEAASEDDDIESALSGLRKEEA